MKRLAIFVLLIVVIFQITACQSKSETKEVGVANSSTIGNKGNSIYKEDYIEACTLISKKYIYLESKLNKSREAFLRECMEYAETVDWKDGKAQFIEEIRKLRSKFADGHFDWQLDEKNWMDSSFKYLGFTLTIGADDKVYVGKVYPHFTDKISSGDEIIKWNGEDVREEIERLGKLLPQSTKYATDEKAARWLTIEYPDKPLRNELKPATVTYRDKDGLEAQAEFEWQDCGVTGQWEKFDDNSDMVLFTRGYLPSLEDIPTDARYVSPFLPFYTRNIASCKYVILHPRCFTYWTSDDLDSTFKQILEEKPDVLVVDLKDSAGGSFEQMLYLAHALNINKSFSFSYDMIESETGKRTTGVDNFDNISDSIKLDNVWKGEVIFRINPITVSAGDFFSRWMQLAHRGMIIGRPSAGAGGGTSDFTLQNTKTIISIPMRERKIASDSKNIEGHSVIPDKIYYGELVDFIKGYGTRNK